MPRNGSGTSSVINTFVVDTIADPDEVNANFQDVADQLTDSLPRDGQAGMTAPLPLANGSAGTPALTFTSDPDTGIYRKAANKVAIAGNGVDLAVFGADGLVLSGGAMSGEFIRGNLYGLTLSNNVSDAVNDIDIATGFASSDGTTPFQMSLASGITKRLDAAWAVGTNQGGLDTGSIANGTYHVWLIQRSDTGVVDALFSTSATAPTMPTNYDRKRRIGSIIRESAAIVAFNQAGDVFRRAAKVDRSSTSALASTLLTISIPAGIQVQPILQSELTVTASNSSVQNAVGSAFEGSASITFQAVLLPGTAGAATDRQVFPPVVVSNTSAQIYYAVTVAAGSINSNTLSTIGWIDRRGRF